MKSRRKTLFVALEVDWEYLNSLTQVTSRKARDALWDLLDTPALPPILVESIKHGSELNIVLIRKVRGEA